jgi:hypothetical protein
VSVEWIDRPAVCARASGRWYVGRGAVASTGSERNCAPASCRQYDVDTWAANPEQLARSSAPSLAGQVIADPRSAPRPRRMATIGDPSYLLLGRRRVLA